MLFELDENKVAIREGVKAVCSQFPDEYWRARDDDGAFPEEFHRAMAEGGWLGMTMPEEYGGSNLGVAEAAVMMHTVGNSGGGMAAASTVQINLFGPHPILLFGTEEQKKRWVPDLVAVSKKWPLVSPNPTRGLIRPVSPPMPRKWTADIAYPVTRYGPPQARWRPRSCCCAEP